MKPLKKALGLVSIIDQRFHNDQRRTGNDNALFLHDHDHEHGPMPVKVLRPFRVLH